MDTALDDNASVGFHAFFERHYAELPRLAALLTGEPHVADDLAADAPPALRHRWDRVRAADHPVAYAPLVIWPRRTRPPFSRGWRPGDAEVYSPFEEPASRPHAAAHE